MVFQLIGMTEKDELYRKLIREGQITRGEAMERNTGNDDEHMKELKIIDKVLARMELSEQESNLICRLSLGAPRLKNSWE